MSGWLTVTRGTFGKVGNMGLMLHLLINHSDILFELQRRIHGQTKKTSRSRVWFDIFQLFTTQLNPTQQMSDQTKPNTCNPGPSLQPLPYRKKTKSLIKWTPWVDIVFTVHFSGPRRAINRSIVCLSVRTIADLWPSHLAGSSWPLKVTFEGHNSKFTLTRGKCC